MFHLAISNSCITMHILYSIFKMCQKLWNTDAVSSSTIYVILEAYGSLWLTACMCHICFHWRDLMSLQVCVPLIQSTLSLDSSPALQGTPSRVPGNQSLVSATPVQKSGIEIQTCLQLCSRCWKQSPVVHTFMLFHLQWNSNFSICFLESSVVVIYIG